MKYIMLILFALSMQTAFAATAPAKPVTTPTPAVAPTPAPAPPSQPKTDFPAALTPPPEDTTLSANTPGYVIIRPKDQVTFSSETAASVSNIAVKESSSFQKGDTLLELDCRLPKAELKKVQAQQAAAKVARDAAKKLQSYGAISDFEVVKAVSDEQIANAEVDKLNAIVDKCVIKAPFNGSVSEVMVHEHESVKPGDPLVKIVNTENLEFEMQIPSCWLSSLHLGSTFKVHINETNKDIPAEITKVNPEIEPISQSVKIIATITTPDPTLLPGMSGQAVFSPGQLGQCTQSKTQ